MTATEEKLLEVGTALARSMGHRLSPMCPKVSASVPCTCGRALTQSKALSDWDHLVQQIKES